jgi:hypothetical protein
LAGQDSVVGRLGDLDMDDFVVFEGTPHDRRGVLQP